jgi:hypothetical protein
MMIQAVANYREDWEDEERQRLLGESVVIWNSPMLVRGQMR